RTENWKLSLCRLRGGFLCAWLRRRFSLFLRLFFGRRLGRVFHLAFDGLLLDGGQAALLIHRDVFVLGTVQDEIEGLAFDELGGQGFEQVLLFQLGTHAPGRFVGLV